MHFLEDRQQGAAIAANLADEFEQFLAEPLAFGEKHGVPSRADLKLKDEKTFLHSARNQKKMQALRLLLPATNCVMLGLSALGG